MTTPYRLISRALERAVALPTRVKRAIIATLDFFVATGVLWALISARYGVAFWPDQLTSAVIQLSGPTILVCVFGYAGIYKGVTRYADAELYKRMIALTGFSILAWSTVLLLAGQSDVPRSSIILFGVATSFATIAYRELFVQLNKLVEPALSNTANSKITVLIHGANEFGLSIARYLARDRRRHVLCFVDDRPSVHGRRLGGLRIHPPSFASEVAKENKFFEVVVAGDIADREGRRASLDRYAQLGAAIRAAVAIPGDTNDQPTPGFRSFEIAELLGREPISAVPGLIQQAVEGQVILVTGAGGSIGAALSEKLLQSAAKAIVLLDVSEAALFEVNKKLTRLRDSSSTQHPTRITCVLGSAGDAALMRHLIKHHKITTIFHSAAYKHLPILEENIAIAVDNNTIATLEAAKVAADLNIEKFVLISTDKAVQPTSVLGITKHLAELAIRHQARSSQTCFATVRFGNVLGSSGSAITIFKEQIEAGGPVTVTHPDATRYFMSVEEAVDLVIQASSLANNGDLFVLDMGQPVNINNVARRMISLAGRFVSEEKSDGGIIINNIGLRPGEKLHEILHSGELTPVRRQMI